METYFIRSRGKVAGPIGLDALQQLVRRGKVSRFDQVSTDRATWQTAGDVGELFAPAAAASRRPAAVTAGGDYDNEADDFDDGVGIAEPAPRRRTAAAPSPAAANFYYAQNGAAVGPLPLGVLQSLAANGTLRGDDQVWADGAEVATPARQVPMLASHFSGRQGTLAYATPSAGGDAGFWLRAVAFVIDSILAGLGNVGVLFVIGLSLGFLMDAAGARPQTVQETAVMLGSLLGFVFPWLYFAIGESSAHQATLGKRAIGIIVTDENGGRISFGRATGRYFAKLISAIILCIGYVMAAFTARKQALHDIICSTYVVRK